MAKKKSCYGCTAPKRHAGCHATCPDYARDDAEHKERKAAEYKAKQINTGLNSQRAAAVSKAMKMRRNGYRTVGKGRIKYGK